MKEDVKAEWVEALRSGDYPQTTGMLRNTDKGVVGYCCLGVLCDLYQKSNPPLSWDEWSNGVPVDKVYEWAGVDPGKGFFSVVDGRPVSLIRYNDERLYTFPMIADVIEAQL